MPERDFSWPIYDVFEDSAGKQIFVSAVTEGQWATVCKLLGLEELLDDPRLATRMQQIEARSWTLPLVAEKIRSRTIEDLTPLFEEHGIPFSPIAKPCDMYDDPHVMRPGGLAESKGPDGMRFRAPSLPFEVDGQMLTGGGDVPAIGQDTQAVFEALGLSHEDIAAAGGVEA